MADDVAEMETHEIPGREPVIVDLVEFKKQQSGYFWMLPPWARASLALQFYLKGTDEKIAPPIDWPSKTFDRHCVCWSEEPSYLYTEKDGPQIDAQGREIIIWLVTGTDTEFKIYGWKRAKHCIQEAFFIDGFSYHVPIDALRHPEDRQYEADSPDTWAKNLEAGRPTT